MSKDFVTFREKYEWWIATGHGSAAAPEYIENEYNSHHPPYVTADKVANEWCDAATDGDFSDTRSITISEFCSDALRMALRYGAQLEADRRNAVREDYDEEWIEKALTRLVNNGFVLNYDTVKQDVRTVIRVAYRARKGS